MEKTRRTFTPEFKAQAVKLVAEGGKSLAEVARDLDLGESMLRAWKAALAMSGENAFPGKGNPPALEQELRRRRAEVKRLTMERDVLKKRRPLRQEARERRRGSPRNLSLGPCGCSFRGDLGESPSASL